MRKTWAVLFIGVIVFAAFAAQGAMAKEKKAVAASGEKEERWSGTVTRSDKDGMTLTVRRRSTTVEKIVHYDASTQWTETTGKTAKTIEAKEVKDGDRVICIGKYDEKGEFQAKRIDLRKK